MNWNLTFEEDPFHHHFPNNKKEENDAPGCRRRYLHSTRLVSASCPLSQFLAVNSDESFSSSAWKAFQEGNRVAQVALADWVARTLEASSLWSGSNHDDADRIGFSFQWSLLTATSPNRRNSNHSMSPFVLERTDIWCHDKTLHLTLRVWIYQHDNNSNNSRRFQEDDTTDLIVATKDFLTQQLLTNARSSSTLMNHVATSVLQDKIRAQLKEQQGVAFVANHSILPRKSGASQAPMSSPPAVPFHAPTDSPMQGTLSVSMGSLRPFLTAFEHGGEGTSDVVQLKGLIVKEGISLIVGGGYHGKSTLLRTIACGVYNKVPGDGREFSVTVQEAVTVRAEDGRYVNKCNISAFISNLPQVPGMTQTVDTTQFSTGEASGSTSQATNVVEAMEMGCSALLVDEDVSAANFMARDGRMRSLVMDESITPLLYRVNGLYEKHGISSIVVVGGVGDWLDVPHHVILMDKYTCQDATAKARSVSRQFSHGHVQFGGQGVVHRLEWDNRGTPIPRRPTDAFLHKVKPEQSTVALVEGSHTLALPNAHDFNHYPNDESEERLADMSKCEQLVGKKAQLYGCGLCLLWLLEESRKLPDVGLNVLLEKLDEFLDQQSFASLVMNNSLRQAALLSSIGCAVRPRRFEVGQALTRLRDVRLELTFVEEDLAEKARLAEEERKKKELMDLWNARRKK